MGVDLDPEILRLERHKVALLQEITETHVIPTETNEPHDIWCIDRSLARDNASPELLPQIVHHIKLETRAIVLVSEIK